MGGKISGRIKKNLKEKIEQAHGIIFFLDYDGTLTRIRKKPALAKIKNKTKALLKRLAAARWCKVFVISGRSLRDIRRLVGVRGIYYAGNHGIELEGPGLRYINPQARKSQSDISACYVILKKRLKFKGVTIENKIYTLSVHYRLAAGKSAKRIRRACIDAVEGFLKSKSVRFTEGKKVIEIRPRTTWDKGKIVHWVLKRIRMKNLPIYIGDDRTDEDAFRAIGGRGVTILVSPRQRRTSAQYRLGTPYDVIKFLCFVLNGRQAT